MNGWERPAREVGTVLVEDGTVLEEVVGTKTGLLPYGAVLEEVVARKGRLIAVPRDPRRR